MSPLRNHRLVTLASRLRGQRPRELTTVWLPASIRTNIESAASERAPDEVGGILLGYEAPGGDVVVTHLVGPGPRARFRRARFEPDGLWHEKEVARIYAATARRSTYLGDWHSHPAGVAVPSRADNRTARRIARHSAARMPRPLMVIAARESGRWEIAAFRYVHRRLRRATIRGYADPVAKRAQSHGSARHA